MTRKLLASSAAFAVGFGIYGMIPSRAQEPAGTLQISANNSECTFFGPDREKFLPRLATRQIPEGQLTRQFAAMSAGRALISRAGQTRPFTAALAGSTSTNLIDQQIFAALQTNGITPANKTNDYEFIRRVTLDLTGRIPTAARVATFVAGTGPAKRSALIDELLARPEWVDKWTMYFGDLYKNTSSNLQITIEPEGRNAFYKYIHDSLAAGKPYNQMATEMIAAQGGNNLDQTNGQMNYLLLGYVGGGPVQDVFDGQTAKIANNFLGIAHMDCLLCHNGRGHLDSLSLWGSQTTRAQAWGMSAFLAKTKTAAQATPADPVKGSTYRYWALQANTIDYQLNTTTGNRPARQPIGAVKAITPTYIFNSNAPASGQDYRVALAQNVTGDFQFARATVNYLWAQFFGMGIVDPPDQFDPARLDPDNPPPAPWTLQPSNPALLNALAQSFIDSGYDVKALMSLIANSDTYQLASDYAGTWNPAWDSSFGRKFVRRLWSEEVHDSTITAINTFPSYTANGFTADSAVYGVTSPGFGKITYAMQAPDVVNTPDNGGAVSQFQDTFLRGNRDDQPRKGEGSILQALALMNDNFIQSRIHATGTGTTATFLMRLLTQTDTQLIGTLFMDVLSRPPSATELQLAQAELANGGAVARKTNAEDLLWTLFNKLDFVFNY